jgi:hypothetical protein
VAHVRIGQSPAVGREIHLIYELSDVYLTALVGAMKSVQSAEQPQVLFWQPPASYPIGERFRKWEQLEPTRAFYGGHDNT